ncbi:MAG TPA: hypothetical protein GXZ66_00625 [Clostridiaceae bacterium]|jgi:hypothetical protein|nr:hypothetical protein [Clostridiaceae bacterium]
MRKIPVQKEGFNRYALLAGPFWYISRGMTVTGLLMLFISLMTAGIGIIPVWLYCGRNANRHFYKYLKRKNVYIRN